MKILYHHRTRSRDGQRVHIDGLIGAMRRAGHEVFEVGPESHENEDHGRVSRSRGYLRPLREAAEMAYNVVEIRQLQRAVREVRPDALYSRHALYCQAPAAIARRAGLPWIVEVNAPLAQERARHGGLSFPQWARRSETRFLNQAGRVVVVTEVMRDIMIEQGVGAQRIEVHYNGIDPTQPEPALDAVEALRRQRSLENRTVLGFVGFVRDWNRLERVYQCLRARPDTVFLVVGDGPDCRRLQQRAEQEGVAGQVQFLGAVSHSDVPLHVRLFDVALIPETPIYASPLKLLDYLAAGRCILAPDRANLRQVLQHGDNAYLFDSEQDESFQTMLGELAGDVALRRRLGDSSRGTIDRLQLTWDHNASRVVQQFEALQRGGAA